jgi:ubiquinone/menaquinone biosynthesis C-methylase UbiE
MKIQDLQKNWDRFGKTDPFWAILSTPEAKEGKWEIDKFFLTGKKEIEQVLQNIQNLNLDLRYQKALDFGCGVGRLSQALSIYFSEVHGVDIAPSMIDLANKYNTHGNKCHYHLNDKNNLELFESNSFDFIYTNITLQHMKPEYSKKYIQEFLRILAPQGILVFQIPSHEKITSKIYQLRKFIYYRVSMSNRGIKFLYSLYHKIRYGTTARMEMYGIEEEKVIKLIEANGGKILEVQQNNIETWVSCCYFCFKK